MKNGRGLMEKWEEHRNKGRSLIKGEELEKKGRCLKKRGGA